MAEKKELTLEERYLKYASSKSEAKRVMKLMEGHALLDTTLDELLHIPGIGRKAALLIMQVGCDLYGKK